MSDATADFEVCANDKDCAEKTELVLEKLNLNVSITKKENESQNTTQLR